MTNYQVTKEMLETAIGKAAAKEGLKKLYEEVTARKT
jgi:hypothetical protein